MFRNYSVFVLAAILTWALLERSALAQQPTWSSPQLIYQTQDLIDRPILLSDSSGRLHLFWQERELAKDEAKRVEERITGNSALYYMVKDENGWSQAVDVLSQSNLFLSGVVDPFGRIHLVMSDPTLPARYVRSLSPNALTARAWSQPIALSETAVTNAAIALDSAGVLHAVYCTTDGVIKYLSSMDWGEHWTTATPTVNPFPVGQAAGDQIYLVADMQGTLHMLWNLSEISGAYRSLEVQYAHSTDGGTTWSAPQPIAPAGHVGFSIKASDDGRLHVLTVGRVGTHGRYHRWSADDGITWSDPLIISSPEYLGGASGGDLAIDSAFAVHAVVQRDVYTKPGSDSIGGYSFWRGGSWSPLVDIALDVPGHIEHMSIEVTHGNRLHAVWPSWTDRSFLWYAEGTADAPFVPGQPLKALPEESKPQASSISEQVVGSTKSPGPTYTPAAPVKVSTESSPTGPSSAFSIVLSTLLSLGIISFVLIRQLLSRSQR